MLAGLPQITFLKVWHSRARRKSFPKWFGVSAHGESYFSNGLEFPRMAKVLSRMVWSFRAWRESFPEWFGISALGESHFPKGLAFPRSPKVVSRMVWHFRAWRKSFPKWFGISCCKEIANILTKRLDRIELVEERELEPTPQHENIRGKEEKAY